MSHSRPLLKISRALVLGATFALGQVGVAVGQTSEPPTLHAPYAHDTGWVSNTTGQPRVVISFPVHVPEAEWLRLYFDEVHLSGDQLAGSGALLRITSHHDGFVQEMNASHVEQWQRSSAYFNGDTVQVDVLVQPFTGPSRLVLRSVDAGLPALESQCGPTDDRVASTDVRAARLLPIGCTGWLIDDCQSCFLTAGHCTGAISVIQFNVPLSNSNGSLNNPPPSDQYVMDASSLQTNGGQGVGNDWGYFGAFPNSTTGLTAVQAQGATYTLAFPPPVDMNNIRITGFGVDGGSANQTLQTGVGPMITNSGTTVQYKTDTTGGNSGSPVIWEETGFAVGIHTHGGCATDGTGQNSGTGANHPGLQAALATPAGICAGGVTLPNGPPPILSDTTSTTVLATIQGSPVMGTASAHYRYQGGTYTALPMTDLGGGNYSVDLPPAGCNDSPEFYFSVTDASCGLVTNPGNAPMNVYSALVGTAAISFADDFETDTGWTTAILGATTGAWERGIPVNDPNWAYDPTSDSDGSGQCYLTMNALGNTDVDNGAVQLITPALDLSAGSVIVQYDYYLNLSVADGVDRMVVEARDVAGGGAYSIIAIHDTSGGLDWRTANHDSTAFTAAGVVLSNQVQLRFTANDGAAATFVEAGIDAFQVFTIDCGGGGLGTNYCVTGQSGATMAASGTASVGANNLVLIANGVPANENGTFYYGDTQIQVPFGLGNMCVDGTVQVYRLNPPTNSGATGTLTHALDITNPPGATGQITAGSTWNFQAWFRVGAGQFDLSDGLELTFVP
jgi:V8-like Glu-specific endopeptidase